MYGSRMLHALLVANFCGLVCASFFDYHANRVNGLDGTVFGGKTVLENYTDVKSAVECALSCGRHIACMAFSFHERKAQCRLYAQGFFEPTTAISEPGWAFYNFASVSCPLQQGFVHSRVHNLCIIWLVTPSDYHTARNSCHGVNAEPISLNTRAKIEAFKEIFNPVKSTFGLYVGLRKGSSGWMWKNGEPATSDNWSNSPGSCGTNCNCAVARGDDSWKFEVTSCYDSNIMICEHK